MSSDEEMMQQMINNDEEVQEVLSLNEQNDQTGNSELHAMQGPQQQPAIPPVGGASSNNVEEGGEEAADIGESGEEVADEEVVGAAGAQEEQIQVGGSNNPSGAEEGQNQLGDGNNPGEDDASSTGTDDTEEREIPLVTDQRVLDLIREGKIGHPLLADFYDRFCPRDVQQKVVTEGVVKGFRWRFEEHLSHETLHTFRFAARTSVNFGLRQRELASSLRHELIQMLDRRENQQPVQQVPQIEVSPDPIEPQEERLRAQLDDMTPQDVCRLLLNEHCPRYDETSSKADNVANIATWASISYRTCRHSWRSVGSWTSWCLTRRLIYRQVYCVHI